MIVRLARSACRGARRLVVPVAVFVAVTASLVLATRRFQAEQIATVRGGAENELLAVADLKVDQLMAYHRERMANAASLRSSGFTADGVEDLLRRAPRREVERTLAAWFRTMATQYGYSRITLALPDGTVVREWPRSSTTHLPPPSISAATRAFETGSPAIFHGAAESEATIFRILAPVFRSADGAPLAIVSLEADIEATLSAAAHWPVPRQTARVSFLAERPGDALKLAALLASEDAAAGNVRLSDAAAKSLLRQPGTVQRVRERDRDVLAVAAAVPGTPWTVVTQIDEDEVLALARARGLVALLSVVIATTVLAIATALWIRRASRAARRRETALRTELDEIQRQFMTLSGMVNDAFLLIDRGGRIIDANDRAAATYGYSIEELRELEIFDLRAPSTTAQTHAQLDEVLARGGLRFETVHRRRDGSTFPVEVSARAIRGRAGELYYSVVRDLSELTSLHSQLAFADRMASVGTLAAGVAHEINNPLAYVLANIGYAEEELARVDCEEVKQALTDAREGARRVRQIVLDLKAFAREDERAPGSTDVGEAIRFALSLVQNEVRHRARLEVDVGEVSAVRGSEHRIGQVLVNLLVNAAHAIPPGRASENLISITARQADDGGVEISVRDTGVGIAAEVLPRIFDPFFTTKPVGAGTGLGLAVCHGIVTQLGGSLRVESAVGAGSTFHVVLPPALEPANEPAVPAPDEDRVVSPLLGRARVLVIDDEPLVASSVARVLGGTCVVESAHDASAALSWAAVSRYDLVLCDLMMPDVSGAEFYAALLAKSPELAHRTVFLTGGAFTEEAQAFLSCVNPPVVAKPFEPEQLRLAIARALSPVRETAAA